MELLRIENDANAGWLETHMTQIAEEWWKRVERWMSAAAASVVLTDDPMTRVKRLVFMVRESGEDYTRVCYHEMTSENRYIATHPEFFPKPTDVAKHIYDELVFEPQKYRLMEYETPRSVDLGELYHFRVET